MKMIVAVALALVAVASAAPAAPAQGEYIPIVQEKFEQQPDGSYLYGYESADGSKQEQTGELKDAVDEDNKPHTVVVVRGSFEYPGVDGKPVIVTYEADENGYRAVGDSIPKPARR